MRKLPRPQRTCIFCGGKGLTYEHAFAEWLQACLKSDQSEHYFGDHDLWPNHVTHTIKKWGGDPYHRRLRIVCKSCNGGWMSDLQQAVKSYLVPLLEGRNYILSLTAQEIMAAWATMSVMVSEYFVRPEKRSITQDERREFWLSGKPPTTFKIWIGRYA